MTTDEQDKEKNMTIVFLNEVVKKKRMEVNTHIRIHDKSKYHFVDGTLLCGNYVEKDGDVGSLYYGYRGVWSR